MFNIFIDNFTNWLKKYSKVELMHSRAFVEYKINSLLKSEAEGYIMEENNSTFTAIYEYAFTVSPKHSTDNKPHTFRFEVKVLGLKSNLTANDYEIEDYMELEYMIKWPMLREANNT